MIYDWCKLGGKRKTITLNTATGTHCCAIESAMVSFYLRKTQQGGIVSTFSVISTVQVNHLAIK